MALVLAGCGGAAPAPPVAPPVAAPVCEQLAPVARVLVARPARAGADLGAALAAQLVHACLVDDWAAASIRCALEARAGRDLRLCDRTLSAVQRDHLARAMTEIIAASARRREPIGVAECDAYVDEMARYDACAQVPDPARDAARETLRRMRATWIAALASGGDDERGLVSSECAQARVTLAQAMAAVGC